MNFRLPSWHGLVTTLRDAAAAQLARVGEPLRDLRHFLGDSRRWSRWQHEAFHGPQLGRMNGGTPIQQLLSVLPPNTQFMPDFATFATQFADVQEIVRWSLFDILDYPAAGVASLRFFQQGESAGLERTNMKLPSALPGGEGMIVAAIRMQWLGTTASVIAGDHVVDAYNVLGFGSQATWEIARKQYFQQGPLTYFAAGEGIGTVAAAGGPAIGNNGTPDLNSPPRIDPPLGILPTRTFVLAATWEPAATLQTAETTGHLLARLDGWMLRAVQ